MLADYQKKIINIHEYFNRHPENGIVTAIQTLLVPEDEIFNVDTYDIIKFKSNGAELITCDNFYPPSGTLPEVLTFTHDYINSNLSCAPQGEFLTAIPIFDINESNKTLLVIKNEAIVPNGVSDEILTQFDSRIRDNPAYVMNAANKFAISQNYAGGISPCTRNSDGNWIVWCIKDGYLEQDSVYPYEVNHYTNFSYNYPDDLKEQLIIGHEIVTSNIGTCAALDPAILRQLQANYRLDQVIHNTWDSSPCASDPGAVGCAEIGGNRIWVKFDGGLGRVPNLNELAKVLIHEMMHIAGFSHPNRNDPNYPNSLPVLAQQCIRK
ncbi:hypothetical protein MRP26_29380 [Bacillus sp. CCB-MMP212]|uniref:hypothetical protein n=1 Tax=Bacillus sp. CCB-MMP212 TaxID=2928002 RepID=UPI001F617705|nr:hypothetical protein [Bacillus sp. CCB-MMP212]MCI4253003.1 hypothetical protein [Bacillus sp. CCB-MMP212]